MAGQDYVPNFLPAHELSFTAGATITAGQLVYISAANTVSPTSSASTIGIGVAAAAASSGAAVDVYTVGVHTLAASGAIAAGAAVISAASGAVATIASDTTYDQVVGTALDAAANNLVMVLLG